MRRLVILATLMLLLPATLVSSRPIDIDWQKVVNLVEQTQGDGQIDISSIINQLQAQLQDGSTPTFPSPIPNTATISRVRTRHRPPRQPTRVPVVTRPITPADPEDSKPLPSSPNPSTSTSSPIDSEALAAHNQYRSSKGVPALSWSADLASGAQAYASQLASTGTFQHSQDAGLKVGENLFKSWSSGEFGGGRGGGNAGVEAVEAWASERNEYETAGEPPVCSGGVGTVGHWTQMIWRDTREVGCGVGESGGTTVVVCRYSPPGNRCGQKPF
ncbi:hypothetical protein HK102_006835 [Quaeritorhiza haematococci]|nr:hypothetical protein HK102_006835 [Quaeritorhiza haematococci]